MISNTKSLVGGRLAAWVAAIALAAAPMAGCANDLDADAADEDPAETAVRAEIKRLETAMAKLPGDLVVTRSTGPSLDEATRAKLAGATKLIHVYSDGRVAGYHSTGSPAAGAEPSGRFFFVEFGGDIVLGPNEELPDFIIDREAQLHGVRIDRAVGLSVGNGKLWRDSTVGYEVDSAFSAAERDIVLDAIGSWNQATDAYGELIHVRFVPRYLNDGRGYVKFVRSASTCGSSLVGSFSSSGKSHDVVIGCINEGTMHHEMGHTTGLWHEQQRSDRNSYIYVGATGMDCEIRSGSGIQNYLQYNYRSVMHYGYGSCGMKPITPTGTNYRGVPLDAGYTMKLDTQDVQAINTMYTGKRSLPPVGAGIYYYLTPQHATTKAVAVPGASTENATQLIIWDRAYPDQHWELIPDSRGYFELRNRATGKCMEDYAFSMDDLGAVVQFDCWGGDNQKWIVAPSANDSGAFDIINKLSLKSLDVYNSNTGNGNVLVQYTHNATPNQRFKLIRAF